MKKTIVLSVFFVGLVSATYAQDMIVPEEIMTPEDIVQPREAQPDQDRLEINESELPEPVVRALDEGSYEGMVIAEAFVLQGDALKEAALERIDIAPRVLYEVQLWRGNDFSTVYFTEEGELYEADRSV